VESTRGSVESLAFCVDRMRRSPLTAGSRDHEAATTRSPCQGSRIVERRRNFQLGSSADRVQVVDQDGELMVLFLFARTDVRPNDKLKFTSQFGPLQFAADFKTKEMQFAGSLDL
jgi:hypothetical protein